MSVLFDNGIYTDSFSYLLKPLRQIDAKGQKLDYTWTSECTPVTLFLYNVIERIMFDRLTEEYRQESSDHIGEASTWSSDVGDLVNRVCDIAEHRTANSLENETVDAETWSKAISFFMIRRFR